MQARYHTNTKHERLRKDDPALPDPPQTFAQYSTDKTSCQSFPEKNLREGLIFGKMFFRKAAIQ